MKRNNLERNIADETFNSFLLELHQKLTWDNQAYGNFLSKSRELKIYLVISVLFSLMLILILFFKPLGYTLSLIYFLILLFIISVLARFEFIRNQYGELIKLVIEEYNTYDDEHSKSHKKIMLRDFMLENFGAEFRLSEQKRVFLSISGKQSLFDAKYIMIDRFEVLKIFFQRDCLLQINGKKVGESSLLAKYYDRFVMWTLKSAVRTKLFREITLAILYHYVKYKIDQQFIVGSTKDLDHENITKEDLGKFDSNGKAIEWSYYTKKWIREEWKLLDEMKNQNKKFSIIEGKFRGKYSQVLGESEPPSKATVLRTVKDL